MSEGLSASMGTPRDRLEPLSARTRMVALDVTNAESIARAVHDSGLDELHLHLEAFEVARVSSGT